MTAPKPASRDGSVSFLRYLRLFRRDILSAQPQRLYRAWMAEFRTPFFQSFLINQPALIRHVLEEAPEEFPKSERVVAGLRPLLGNSVFVTNGRVWQAQRRIIDPAFGGGRLKAVFNDIRAAGDAAQKRIGEGVVDVEEMASRATADVIFRTLFSREIGDDLAKRTYQAFRTYQRSQPVLTPAAMLPGLPTLVGWRARAAAREIRAALCELVDSRRDEIDAGQAPDDLATKLMTTPDPLTGQRFTRAEMVDQVAIFFLAGHETSAATLGWALWLLAAHPEVQEDAATEAAAFDAAPEFRRLSRMPVLRDVIRETLRLYPPVPMMVREARSPHVFRGREVRAGAQIVISPWHVHRHERFWDDPDAFRPARWQDAGGQESAAEAYLPFSKGPRMCPGAGFAMVEATVLLAGLLARYRFEVTGAVPVPVAHLTVRSRDGIRLIARIR